jgi:plastocyanin
MTDNLRFKPARVVAYAGDTVEWQNTSSLPHTVTADARRATEGKEVVLPPGAAPFDSGLIAPGGSYRRLSPCRAPTNTFACPMRLWG